MSWWPYLLWALFGVLIWHLVGKIDPGEHDGSGPP